jgi:hypothetical protein
MSKMPYLIQECGAAAAARVPLGREHEVVDDELAPVLEQVEQGDLAVPPSKTYSSATSTMGSPRRSALSASRARVAAFSLSSSSARAARHSPRETISGSDMGPPVTTVRPVW